MTRVQKSLAQTGVLLALAVVAGLSIFLGEKHEEEETKKKDDEAKAFTLDKAKVKKVALVAKGASTEAEKDGDGWKIVAPVKARAEKAQWDAIVDKFAELKSKEVVSEDASKAADFGLDAPQFVAKVTLDDGKELELKVGAENTFDQSLYYTRTGDARIDLSDSGLKYPLDKSLFDLRDKALVTHEDKDVQALEVKHQIQNWSVERDGEGFKLITPVADKADKSTIENVLSRVKNVRAKAFAAEDVAGVSLEAIEAALAAAQKPAVKPAKGKAAPAPAVAPEIAALAQWGLDKPVATVTFAIGADKAKKVLLLGQADENGTKKTFAHLVDGGPVWEVEDSLVTDLGKTLTDLRDKTILSFDKEKVAKVEIVPADGEKVVVTRTKADADAGGAEKFAVEGATTEPKSWKLTSLLYTLSSLKGAAIADDDAKDLAKYGLDKPKYTWTVTGEGGATFGTLLVGSETGSRYWAKSAATNRVFEVEKSTIDDLAKKKDDVVEAPPAAPAADAGSAPTPTPANGG